MDYNDTRLRNGSEMEKPTPGFSIFKKDDDKRLVFGWASVSIKTDGEQLEDRQQDIIDPEDLEEAAYEYVLNFRDTGEEHISTMRKKGKLVESCVLTEEKQKAMGIPPGIVPVAWWIGFKIEDDDAWERVKNGTYKMFSIEGKANRIPVEKGQLRGCGVLVVDDDEILVGTRIERGGRGKVCGPGGHIEDGETPEEAAKREAQEEFGITCEELIPLGTLEDGTSAIFLCPKFSGTPKTDEKEMTDPEWCTMEELLEDDLFQPFKESLAMLKMSPGKRQGVAKTFDEIVKFNPFHDARGRFASSNSFSVYSANPKTKAGAMAISRSAQGGHGTTFNAHKESQGENIDQNYKWLNGGPGAKQLAAQGQLPGQKPKTPPKPKQPPKPQVNYDSHGYADYEDGDFHHLHGGRQYYQQQQLTAVQKKAATSYLEADTEPGSLYSHSQNLNHMMATGQTLTGKYQQTHDGMMSAMHNLGQNVTLTRYDHPGMINSMLSSVGLGSDYRRVSVDTMKKSLVGSTVNENKFLSTTYNDFANAPASTRQVFDTRAVKINYKARADVQGMMPGNGPGGNIGEIVLAPTNGTANRGGRITDIRLTGKMARAKGTQTFNYPQIEIDIEI